MIHMKTSAKANDQIKCIWALFRGKDLDAGKYCVKRLSVEWNLFCGFLSAKLAYFSRYKRMYVERKKNLSLYRSIIGHLPQIIRLDFFSDWNNNFWKIIRFRRLERCELISFDHRIFNQFLPKFVQIFFPLKSFHISFI